VPPARRLYLPVADNAEEAEDAFRKMCQALVIELGQRYDVVGRNQIGDDWVKRVVSQGHTEAEMHDWKSPFDPSFVFSEPIRYPNSIVWRALPNVFRTKQLLKACRWARNSWEHRTVVPSLGQLRIDMQPFAELSKDASLELRSALPSLLKRIDEIMSGNFDEIATPPDQAVPVGGDEIPVEAEAEIEKDDREHRARQARREADERKYPRPRVGGAWVGPRPEKALQFRRQLNDLVDKTTGSSVKSKWGDEAKLQIARLKLIDPMGDLYVDEGDGAIFGYKYGVAYLLGYLGPEPTRNPAEVQGFSLPFSYYLENGDLFQVGASASLNAQLGDTAKPLIAVLTKAAQEFDEIKVTTHGDLFSVTDEGILKIARVEAKDWFPGQLPSQS